MLFEHLTKLPGIRQIHAILIGAEAWWFDFRHRVKTSGFASHSSLTVVGNTASGFDYFPVRPSAGRMALADLSICNHSEYTFVDLGSGKGRMLLLAAEYPFQRIEGVEFAVELHRLSVENIAKFRSGRQKCRRIESLNVDATAYELPIENLVVFLFNPFPPEVLCRVLSKLSISLLRHPREIYLIMLFPEFASLVDSMPDFRIHTQNRRYHIYRSV